MLPPSGDQYSIEFGSLRATVTEVGASLRQFDDGDRRIIWGYPESEMASGGRGQVLCPWPNRLEDGKYTFDGVSAQAGLNEPELHNAIHGLVRWLKWSLVDRSDNSVCLDVVLEPQPAYPYRLRIELRYSLNHEGLRITTTFRNEGSKRAPVGLGFHPYIYAGDEGVGDLTLTIPACSHLVANERNLPIAKEPIASFVGSPSNVGNSRISLKSKVFDDCFTDLVRDSDGRWNVAVSSAQQGVLCTVWGDSAFTHIMCFTGDTLSHDDRRKAVAIEPMTCAPNALRSGEGLVVLEPDAEFSCAWGITISVPLAEP